MSSETPSSDERQPLLSPPPLVETTINDDHTDERAAASFGLVKLVVAMIGN